MKLFVRDKAFYKTFFSLTAVITIQALITFSVSLADNVMLGAYSEQALSGATLVNQIQFILQMIISGITTGVVVLGAQYWGTGDVRPIKSLISLGLKISLAFGLVIFAAVSLFPRGVLALFTNEESIIAEGIVYLRTIRWTYLLFALSNCLVMSLRSVETTVIGSIMSLCTLVINVFLNYCLIFGKLGFPEMGVRGAAIATVTSRVVELVIIVAYLLFIDKKLRMRVSDFLSFDTTYMRSFVRVTLPTLGTSLLWGVAQAAQTAILGHISGAAIAANSIAGVVFQITGVLALCTAGATSVVIGKTIGEGRLEMIKPYCVTLQVIFVLFGLLSSALLLIFKDLIVGFYAITDETRALYDVYMMILAVTTIGTSYEFSLSGGIISGGGDTKYAFIVDNAFMFLFTLPAAALSAFVFNWPPAVTFGLLKADQILKCLPNAIKCNRYRWVKELTKQDAARPAEL